MRAAGFSRSRPLSVRHAGAPAVALLICLFVSPVRAQQPSPFPALPARSAESHGAELEAKAKKTLEEIDFQHTVTFSRSAGMPAALSGVFRNSDLPAKVRVVLEIDGTLLVVPLRFFPAANLYRGTFPTPRRELNYQFQVIRADGKAALSPLFSARPNCNEQTDHSAAQNADTRISLLRETAAKEERAQQLNRLLDEIRILTPEEAHD